MTRNVEQTREMTNKISVGTLQHVYFGGQRFEQAESISYSKYHSIDKYCFQR